MGHYYQVQVEIGKQEDGLWRVEVPGLKGCWVDASTLEEALGDIQEVIAMVIDLYQEEGWELPATIKKAEGAPARASLPVIIEEHPFRRIPVKTRTRKAGKVS